MDKVDAQILSLLESNSRLSYKEIGSIISMTGQAVGNRVNRLLDDGVIEVFTIKVNREGMGIRVKADVKMFMKTHDHKSFLKLIKAEPMITEAYKVASDACYHLKIETTSHQELDRITSELQLYGNYSISILLNKIK